MNAARLQITYDEILKMVREHSSKYVDDSQSIRPEDPVIGKQTLDSMEASFFAKKMANLLNLSIPLGEWQSVNTFDDMIRLLLKHVQQQNK